LDVQEDQLKAMPNPSGIFDDNHGREPEDIWGFVENLDENGEIKRSKYVSLHPDPLRLLNFAHADGLLLRTEHTSNYLGTLRVLFAEPLSRL
jgi:hypothetical protein